MKWNTLTKKQTIKKIKKINDTIKMIEKKIQLRTDERKKRNLLVDRLECVWDLEMYYNNEWDTELFFNNNAK